MLSTDIRLLKFLSLQTFYWLKGVPDEPVQFLLEGHILLILPVDLNCVRNQLCRNKKTTIKDFEICRQKKIFLNATGTDRSNFLIFR